MNVYLQHELKFPKITRFIKKTEDQSDVSGCLLFHTKQWILFPQLLKTTHNTYSPFKVGCGFNFSRDCVLTWKLLIICWGRYEDKRQEVWGWSRQVVFHSLFRCEKWLWISWKSTYSYEIRGFTWKTWIQILKSTDFINQKYISKRLVIKYGRSNERQQITKDNHVMPYSQIYFLSSARELNNQRRLPLY